MNVTLEQANAILEWLTNLLDIAIQTYLGKPLNTPSEFELIHQIDKHEAPHKNE